MATAHEPGGAALFDRGPLPRSGDDEVVQATGFDDASFDQTSGASQEVPTTAT